MRLWLWPSTALDWCAPMKSAGAWRCCCRTRLVVYMVECTEAYKLRRRQAMQATRGLSDAGEDLETQAIVPSNLL